MNTATLIYIAIAYDRYRAVVHPTTYWKVKTRYAAISFVACTVSLTISLPGAVWSTTQIAIADHLSWLDCFGEYSGNILYAEIPSVVLDCVGIISTIVGVIITLILYIVVLKELHTLETHRSQYRMMSETASLSLINLKD